MSRKAFRLKRFYRSVATAPCDGGYGVFLDGRQALTPSARKPLTAPSKALAAAVAQEWRAQADVVDLKTMPLTALLFASIDGEDETASAHWIDQILKYLASDLICYRAEKPETLIARQRECWDPYMDWFRNAYGAPLAATPGVIATPQQKAAVAAVEKALRSETPATVFSLNAATAITGSAVLALALRRRAFDQEAIFSASRLDERFQEEQWGVDAEAKKREDEIREEFAAVARFLSLL